MKYVPVFVLLLSTICFAEDWKQGTLAAVEVTTTQVKPKKVAHHYRCTVSDGALLYTAEFEQPLKTPIHDPIRFAVKKEKITIIDSDGKKRTAQIETRERVKQ